MSRAIGVVVPGKEVLIPVPEYCVHPPGCGAHEVEVGGRIFWGAVMDDKRWD